MAKLNGVKTMNMQDGKITKISYEGAEYAFNEGNPQVGDLIRPHSEEWELNPTGFYICDALDEDGDAFISTHKSDTDRHYRRHYDVFRKVNAKPSTLEAKVDSLDERVTALEAVKAEPKQTPKTFEDFPKGAKVRLLSGGDRHPLNGFSNGDVYEVKKSRYAHRIGERIQIVRNGRYNGYATPDQLELVTQYKTEKRRAKVGERILITNAKDPRYGNGAVMRVERVRISTGGIWANYKSTEVFACASEYEVIVEDAKSAQSLTHKGADYTLVSRKAQPGDVVIVTEGSSSMFVLKDTPYEVTKGRCGRFEVEGYSVYTTQYNRTESNVLVYEPIKEALKVGDTVEVIDGSKAYYGDFKTGTVGKVANVRAIGGSKEIKVETDDDFDRFPASALRKVAEVRTKPLIPQTGDIVRATNAGFNLGEPFKPGDIGVVKHADGTMIPSVTFNGKTLYADVVVIARAKDRVDAA